MALVLALIAGAVIVWRLDPRTGEANGPAPGGAGPGPSPSRSSTPVGTPSPEPGAAASPGPINTAFPGITTFRGNASRTYYGRGRCRRTGQLMKLDPRKPRDPLVWSVPVTEQGADGLGGVWATPAVYGGMVYEATNFGDLLGVDRATGQVRWTIHLPGPTWSSPVAVDGVLLQGDCAGDLHAFDISRPGRPPKELWSVLLDGCIESTPSVFRGMIWVGTRDGGIYGIGDRARS
ncbi:MAG: PQQ-binding-like beta-propeller repeat protein [Actinomycetota bacterium]